MDRFGIPRPYGKDVALINTSPKRIGFAMTEVIVAASLLMTGMTIVVPMILRGNRLHQETRIESMVIDELSSQIERLTGLDETEREKAISELRVPDYLDSVLLSSSIDTQVIDDIDGIRVVVRLNWKRIGNPPPVRLVGWIDPSPGEVPNSETEGQSDD